MKIVFRLKFFLLLSIFSLVFENTSAQKQSTLDSLTKIVNSKASTDTLHIKALNNLAIIFAKTDSAKAVKYALQAKDAALKIKYIKGIASAYTSIGVANSYKYHMDLAIINLELSNNFYKKLEDKRQIASNYNNISTGYSLIKNLAEALRFGLLAENLHRSLKDLEGLSADLNTLGGLYTDMGNYGKAMSSFIESIKISESRKRTQANAQTYINMANVMRYQKNYANAAVYYENAIQILKKYNDPLNLGIAQLNYANIFIEQSAYTKAIYQIDQSLASFTKANFKRGMQICYNNLGALYMRQKKYVDALPYLEKSIDIAEASKNFAGLALVQQNIAFGYTKMGNLKLAEDWFAKAEQSAAKYNKNDIKVLAEIYNHKSSLDSAKGNFQNAFFLRDKYRLIQDSLLNGKLAQQVNELNTKYETEKKQQQISLLNKENKIQILELGKGKLELENKSLENDKNVFRIGSQELLLQQNKILLQKKQAETRAKEQQNKLLASQNEVQKLELLKRNIMVGSIAGILLITVLLGYLFYNRYRLRQEAKLQQEVIIQQDLSTRAVLTAEENERKRISGDLHDGLGQMFSAVKMNLSALKDSLKFKDDYSKEMFGKTMDLVDESCKEVRVISHQMAPNVLLKSGLTAAVRDFINKIDSRKLKINLETFGLQDRLDQNIETVLYRVIQETVNNVIKHSGANSLDIQLNRDEEGINAMIEDNGKGFDASKVDSFEGIGLKNIRTRVNFLKGNVDFSSSPGKGTLVAIFIPF